MAYLMLAVAILSEVGATTCLKYSDGFSRFWPTVGTGAGYLVAFLLLAQTLKSLPVSLTYAVWSGLGTAVIAVIGFTALKEPVTAVKIAGVLLIVAGVVALNLGGAHPDT